MATRTTSFTIKNLTAVVDMAAKHGLSKTHESRFANHDLATEQTGISHHRLKPDQRQPFGHKHDDAEEVYVVLSGSGRVKLDDEIVEISKLDAIRVAPGVTRAFEGGPDGVEFLAFGPHHEGDGEMIQDWRTD